ARAGARPDRQDPAAPARSIPSGPPRRRKPHAQYLVAAGGAARGRWHWAGADAIKIERAAVGGLFHRARVQEEGHQAQRAANQSNLLGSQQGGGGTGSLDAWYTIYDQINYLFGDAFPRNV